MLRTSRKWKHAVRYQARLAFPAEWKVIQGHVETPTGVGKAPSANWVDLTSVITQGLQNDERIGSSIRIRRIAVHVVISCGESPGRENRGCVQLELKRWPDRLGSTTSDSRLLYDDDPDIIGLDWTNGAPRVLGGDVIPSTTTQELGTRDLVSVLIRRKYRLQPAPFYFDNTTGYDAGPFPPQQACKQDGSTHATECSISHVAPHNLGPTGTTAVFAAVGSSVAGTGEYVGARMATPRVGGPFVQRIHLMKSWPMGLKVVYKDTGGTNTGILENQNHLGVRIGGSYLSYSEHNDATHPAYYTMFYRIWFTDA